MPAPLHDGFWSPGRHVRRILSYILSFAMATPMATPMATESRWVATRRQVAPRRASMAGPLRRVGRGVAMGVAMLNSLIYKQTFKSWRPGDQNLTLGEKGDASPSRRFTNDCENWLRPRLGWLGCDYQS
jgi:hypothetical protein